MSHRTLVLGKGLFMVIPSTDWIITFDPSKFVLNKLPGEIGNMALLGVLYCAGRDSGASGNSLLSAPNWRKGEKLSSLFIFAFARLIV
jgi:hypothetical protein